MAPLIASYDAPPQVKEAARHGRQEGRWIRAKCPFCDPDGRKGRSLAVGERGWLCHRCHAEEREQAERIHMHLQFKNVGGTAAADERKRREWALQIAEQSSEITAGDPVDRYLREKRFLVPLGRAWSTDLRRSKLRHPDTKRVYVAMVGLVRDITGTIVAVHRTYLMDDGTRADDRSLGKDVRVENAKLSLGPLLGGAALRLGFDPNADTIGVAEGIESSLAFSMRLRLPCWCGLNANGMAAMRFPPEIRKIFIGPDIGDCKRVGIKAALSLRTRVLEEVRKAQRRMRVEILAPPLNKPGDWADWAEIAAQK